MTDPATATGNPPTVNPPTAQRVSGKENASAAENVSAAKGSAGSGEQREKGLSARVNFWSTIITAFTAGAALLLSVLTYYQLNSRPEISMVMPKGIRVWSQYTGQGLSSLNVIVAPVLEVDRKSDVPAAVLSSTLTLSPPPTPPSAPKHTLEWSSNVEIIAPERGNTTPQRRYIGDAAAFPVTLDSLQTRFLEYSEFGVGGVPAALVPGRWDGNLVINRLAQKPISQKFCMVVSDLMAKMINQNLQSPSKFASWGWYLAKNPGKNLSNRECYQ